MKPLQGRKITLDGLIYAPEMTVEQVKQSGWISVKSFAMKHHLSVSMVHYWIRHRKVVVASHNGRIFIKDK